MFFDIYYFFFAAKTFLLRRDFLRAAVFFLITFFCTALSRVFCESVKYVSMAFLSFAAIAVSRFLIAERYAPRVLRFSSVFFAVTLTYFFAASLIGITLVCYLVVNSV